MGDLLSLGFNGNFLVCFREIVIYIILQSMNIWLKTQNSRRKALKSSWVSTRSLIDSPLPIIAETDRRDEGLSSDNFSLQSQENQHDYHQSPRLLQKEELEQLVQQGSDPWKNILTFGQQSMYNNSSFNQHLQTDQKQLISNHKNSSLESSPFIKKQNLQFSSSSSSHFQNKKSKPQLSKDSLDFLYRSNIMEDSDRNINSKASVPFKKELSSSDDSFVGKNVEKERNSGKMVELDRWDLFEEMNNESSSEEDNKKVLRLFDGLEESRVMKGRDEGPVSYFESSFKEDSKRRRQIDRLNKREALLTNFTRSNPKTTTQYKQSTITDFQNTNNNLPSIFKSSNKSPYDKPSIENSVLRREYLLNSASENIIDLEPNSKIFKSKGSNYHPQTNNSKRFLTTGRKNDIREFIISIIEYCSNEVGLACYNINTGEIFLCQIIERMTYMRTIASIERFYPQQIIFSGTLENTPLIQQLISKFKRTSFRPIKRNLFDETRGYYIYKQRGNNKEQYNPDNKFLSFAALHALINFLENSFEVTFSYSALNIKWHFLEEVLVIDSQTIRDLEIFINYETKKSNTQTFIDNFKCLTDGGTRMLRANILQPLTKISQIKERTKLLKYVLQNKNISQLFTRQLVKYKHYEPITAKFIQSPKPQSLKSLKSYLSAIYSLSRLCFEFENLKNKLVIFGRESKILDELLQKLSDPRLESIRSLIRDNFDEEILKSFGNFNNKIKNKKDSFIFLFRVEKIEDEFAEISRLTYSHTLEDIFKIFEQIKAKCKGNYNMKLQYNQFRGYYISAKSNIDLNQLSKLIESDILHITLKKNIVNFSTDILSSMNNRLKQNENKLIFESEKLLNKLIRQIQSQLQIFFEINYSISVIDMIMSFVGFVRHYQTNYQIVFSEAQLLDGNFIEEGCELVIERARPIWSSQKFFRLSQEINIELLTENRLLNMKKEYNSTKQLVILSSIGYLTILAQMGCLVPAQRYKASTFDMMISKINVEIYFQNKLSRFQTQLYSLKNLLDNAQGHHGNCLILIDQIIKGTQPEQEWALALSSLQLILNQNKSKTVLLLNDLTLFNFISNFSRVSSCYYEQESHQSRALENEIKQLLNSKHNFAEKFILKYESTDVRGCHKIVI